MLMKRGKMVGLCALGRHIRYRLFRALPLALMLERPLAPMGVLMSDWISGLRERAVVDSDLVDQAVKPLAPDAVAAESKGAVCYI